MGPNNRIEPGGPDYGQPTVFEPGRQTTVFAIKVPKDFGEKKLTWTLVANGQPAVVTFYLNPAYNMSFYREEANGNDAPKMKLSPDDPMMSGPAGRLRSDAQRNWSASRCRSRCGRRMRRRPRRTGRQVIKARARRAPAVDRSQVAVVDGRVIGAAAAVAARTSRRRRAPADFTVVWKKVRGPGQVTVTPPRVPLITGGDGSKVVEASATATFSAPGRIRAARRAGRRPTTASTDCAASPSRT